jgi:nucleolar protein 12
MSLIQSIFGDVVVTAANKKSSKKVKKSAKAAAAQEEDSGLANLFDKTIPTEKSSVVVVATDGKKSVPEKKHDSNKDHHKDNEPSNNSSKDHENEEDEEEEEDDDDDDKNLKEQQDDTNKASNDTSNNNKRKKEQTPESMKEEEQRTIFVGNLPLSTTRRSLAKLFATIGKVQSTRLRSVAVTGVKLPPNLAGNQNIVKKVCSNLKDHLDVEAKSSLQGYVVFCSAESVPQAISQCNNKPLQDTNPQATRAIRRIRVDTATATVDPKRSVFVGNLPYQAEEASLQEHFCTGCGLEMNDIEGVRIVRDKHTFECKGIGYILFKDATMVATALQRMPDSVYKKRNLRVNVCGSSSNNNNKRPGGGEAKKKRKSDNNSSHHDGTGSSRKQARSSADGSPATNNSKSPAAGAMRRVAKKNKRVRGEKKQTIAGQTLKPGVSKRANTQVKVEKRVKKLEKRISKGMGKTRRTNKTN